MEHTARDDDACRQPGAVPDLEAAGVRVLTVFAEMSALAERTGAINLGQGFPG